MTENSPDNLEAMAAVVSAVVAVISAIVSVVFALVSRSAQSGALELEIRNAILTTATRVADLALAHTETLRKGVSDPMYEMVHGTIQAAIEQNLTAYDEACAKYLDGKVDRSRFKKMYQTEIRQVVEKPEFRDYFTRTTQFHSLVKVYEDWEHKPKT